MHIIVNTPVEIDPSEIAKAISPSDLGELISYLANKMVTDPNVSFTKRRAVVAGMQEGLSEEGVQLLAEVMAAAFVRAKRENPLPIQ